MEDRSLTGVGAVFSASHHDPVRNEIHGHSYGVTVWFHADPPRDATLLQEMVKQVVKATFDHKTLPIELSRAEAIGRTLLDLIDTAVIVDVDRPLERLYARVVR